MSTQHLGALLHRIGPDSNELDLDPTSDVWETVGTSNYVCPSE
jgi:hypothetical protein